MQDMSNWTAIAMLAAVLIGYVALLCVLALLVQPLRLKLVTLAEDLLDENLWNNDERAEIERLVTSSLSFRTGLLLPVAGIAVGLDLLLGRADDVPAQLRRLHCDPRFDQLIGYYGLSVCAANPLAGLVTFALIPLVSVLSLMRRGRTVSEAVKKPFVRLSEVAAHA